MGSVVLSLAARFIRGARRDAEGSSHGIISFISSVSIAGLTLGVTALLVVTSVMNGFEKELKNALTSFHAHIILFSRGEPVKDPARQIDDLKKAFPEIRAVAPYIFSEVMLSTNGGVSGAVVEGIEEKSFSETSRVPDKIIEGRLPRPTATSGSDDVPAEITLAAELAHKLKAKTGDNLVLTIPFLLGGGAPYSRPMKVVGVVRLGMYDYDSKYALMALPDAQSMLSMGAGVNAFKILVTDMDRSAATAAALNDRYVYPLRARDWSTLNRNLFYAIRLEKAVIGLILFVIILVASFNVVSTIMMLAQEKKRQVAMLRAIGLPPRHTAGIYLTVGSFMAIAGAALGVICGRALCALLQWRSIIDLPADIYLFNRLPVEIRVGEWAAVAAASILLAVLASLWPSWKAARMLPAEGLRHE